MLPYRIVALCSRFSKLRTDNRLYFHPEPASLCSRLQYIPSVPAASNHADHISVIAGFQGLKYWDCLQLL
jgi:hypothetical protein